MIEGGDSRRQISRCRASAKRYDARLSFSAILVAEGRFYRLHNCNCSIRDTVIFQPFKIVFEALSLDDGVVASAVIVAAQPCCDVAGVCNCIISELLAGNLRDIDRNLRLRSRDHKGGKSNAKCAGFNNHHVSPKVAGSTPNFCLADFPPTL